MKADAKNKLSSAFANFNKERGKKDGFKVCIIDSMPCCITFLLRLCITKVNRQI